MDAVGRISLALLLACAPAWADEEVDMKPAIVAAEAWLASVDAGRYGQSWEDGAPFLQQSMPKIMWEGAIDVARSPLGVAVSRKVRQANYTRSLPNAPPGEYVVIQYDTRFETRPLSTEIVTPVKGADGRWKVAGYTIR
jgi:hypothetical protein